MKSLMMVTILSTIALPFSALAVTPMEYYNSLVAGADDAGFRDGTFDDARFNRPCGLAFDETGSRLFVADQNNNRVRVVHLDENNRVETLTGTGAESSADGTLTVASFSRPRGIAYLPGDRLAVYEIGDQSVRMVDLKNNQVTTLARKIGFAWNIVYSPKDNSLYLSEPSNGTLQRLDLKSGECEAVLRNDRRIRRPQALCLYQNQLYVADGDTAVIYQVEGETPEISAKDPLHLKLVGKGKKILELAGSDGCLYALQDGDVSVAQVLPQYKPVSLITPWGFPLENTNPGYEPLLSLSEDHPVGFAASSREPRKFYVAGPRDAPNILSFKDYHFDEAWFARREPDIPNQLSDFDYPADKPPKTFRILVVGSSRVVTAPAVFPGEKPKKSKSYLDEQDFHSLRTSTFPKQLELTLNAQAALQDSPEHFEVLTLGHPGMSIQFFYRDEIVNLAEKYHVDLVLGLVTPSGEDKFEDYYTRPLNGDGIPSGNLNAEYLLKPWKDKIPAGAPARLYENCLKRNLVGQVSPTQLQFALFQDLLGTGDREIRDDLIEMMGKPLKIIARQLDNFRNPDGRSSQFRLFFVPDQDVPSVGVYESFWLDLAARNNLKILDLTKPYEDLKTSFYPTSEACCHHHYTAYGNDLIAYLLSYYLPKENWIPSR